MTAPVSVSRRFHLSNRALSLLAAIGIIVGGAIWLGAAMVMFDYEDRHARGDGPLWSFESMNGWQKVALIAYNLIVPVILLGMLAAAILVFRWLFRRRSHNDVARQS